MNPHVPKLSCLIRGRVSLPQGGGQRPITRWAQAHLCLLGVPGQASQPGRLPHSPRPRPDSALLSRDTCRRPSAVCIRKGGSQARGDLPGVAECGLMRGPPPSPHVPTLRALRRQRPGPSHPRTTLGTTAVSRGKASRRHWCSKPFICCRGAHGFVLCSKDFWEFQENKETF